MLYSDLSAFYSPDLERLIAGVRRLYEEAGIQERRLITKDLLLQILPYLSRRIREDATLYTAFCLVFTAFLRVEEFIYIDSDRGKADFDK